jgi:hypothetical protein
MTGLGKRLQAVLTREQREAVGRFLTGIAAANGIIDRKEVTALRTAYRALDVEVEHLNKLLEEFRRVSQEPVEVQPADESLDRGEVIPPRPKAGQLRGFVLNESLLKRLMAETQDVADMLGEAMRHGDGTSTDEETPSRPDLVRSLEDPRFDGLGTRFHAILSELLARPHWQRAEVDSVIRRYREKTLAAYEAINEWSEEKLGDSLILDQGEEWIIQAQLMESQS